MAKCLEEVELQRGKTFEVKFIPMPKAPGQKDNVDFTPFAVELDSPFGRWLQALRECFTPDRLRGKYFHISRDLEMLNRRRGEDFRQRKEKEATAPLAGSVSLCHTPTEDPDLPRTWDITSSPSWLNSLD